MNPSDDVALGQNTAADSSTFYDPSQTPEGQDERIAEENAAKARSYPIMGDVYEWFEQQIASCPDITNIVFDDMTVNGVTYNRKTSVEAQALAFMLLKKMLMDKADEFKEFKVEK